MTDHRRRPLEMPPPPQPSEYSRTLALFFPDSGRNRLALIVPGRVPVVPTVSAHPPGHRHGDVPARDHGAANGHCRGSRDPNVLRAIPSLPDSGRSADASSMLLQPEDVPNVPAPTCSGGPPVSNILRSTRIPGPEEARALHKRLLVAGSQCIPKSVLNSARRSRLRAVRRASSYISSSVS